MATIIRLPIAKLLFLLSLSLLSTLSAREVKILFSNQYDMQIRVGYQAFATDEWRYVVIAQKSAVIVPRDVPDDQLFNLTLGVSGKGVRRHGFEGITEKVLGHIETLKIELNNSYGDKFASFVENVLLPAPTVFLGVLAGERRT